MSGFAIINAPRGHFYSDPSIVQDAGHLYLFCENYEFARRKGTICCSELDSNGCQMSTSTVLDGAHHLSYPHVFFWRDRWFMVPEAAKSGAVTLYVAKTFPWRWEEACILVDEPLLDPTLVRKDEKWYLFGTPACGTDRIYDRLSIFIANDLEGPYGEITGSPLRLGSGRARMGGAFLQEDGMLLRVAQNCDKWYGHSLGLWRVNCLAESLYSEEHFRTIGPDWWPSNCCVHTYSRTQDWEAVDMCFFGFSPVISALRVLGAIRSKAIAFR